MTAIVVSLDGARGARRARGSAAAEPGQTRRRAAPRARRGDILADVQRRALPPWKAFSHEDSCLSTLIGAGPGDPGLITVHGLECLRAPTSSSTTT